MSENMTLDNVGKSTNKANGIDWSSNCISDLNLKKVTKWSLGTTETGNTLIHGDNLAALKLLSETHARKVKCVYLDPPYNNGESYLHYFDNMTHEEWLKAVTARLEHITKLLCEEGSVWISIDDSELHYLKIAADTVFGRSNFIGTIIWERRTTRENRKVLSRNHEYLLVYAKNLSVWSKVRNSLPLTEEVKARYKNPDADERGPWQSVSANVQSGHATKNQYYALKAPNGKIHQPPKGRCWIYSESKMLEEISKNNVWFGKDGNAVPRLKKFFSERKRGLTPETLWRAEEVGTTSSAKKHLLELFKEASVFDTPKPEQLIHRILQISTNPGDLVLDPYLGSGTTAAVAHKMGRAYIGIELGEHIETHCADRLQQVINGESGGVSQTVGWSGGGGFELYRL
ncbi:MAG: site-specific DNA-methyltransferase [Idiomarina sp.]